jgi:hypothetical protein
MSEFDAGICRRFSQAMFASPEFQEAYR